MKEYIVDQNYEQYTEEDHAVWKELWKRQGELDESLISQQYVEGFKRLEIDRNRIPRIEDISSRLEKISGWDLIPVDGLIPAKDFFLMLINKSYPITVHIRKRDEFDFSEQPDIFHDICGHLPLLTNERFLKFLTSYCIIAIKYAKNERAVEFLGRLYWYTYEMGLIKEEGVNKPYGGAVLTSSREIQNINEQKVSIHPFDLSHIFRTMYNPFDLQKEYFYIHSFDELFLSLEKVEEKLLEILIDPEPTNCLLNYPINDKLGKNFENVIGFLNDTQFKYPEATSFVAGQPDENFFDVEDHVSKFDRFVEYKMKQTGKSRKEVVNYIGQYGMTKGIINDILAKYLNNDDDINVNAREILVTSGAQEAFSVIVSTICNKETDVVLTEDPSYIGLSSFAKVFGYDIQGVAIDEEGIDLRLLREKILDINQSDKRLKLVYVIPDHQNPSGSCMPIGSRLKLLELAERYNFLIIEDSVYNSFTYRQKRIPTLKSLDKYNRVIYVGSFSKSLFPGLRIGYTVANQKLENEYGEIVPLMDEMIKVKAQVTNNTSAISQAVLGGVLVDFGFSLNEYNKPKFKSYQQKLEHFLLLLDEHVGKYHHDWASGISWNSPNGGFFIKMNVPFTVDKEAVIESARKFSIIFCPMSFFYLREGGENEIRLTFSNLSLQQIEEGVIKLAAYLEYKTAKNIKLLQPEASLA